MSGFAEGKQSPTPRESGLISVVIPCFNKAEYVRETLDSVLQQEGVRVEVIAIDDASTDQTWEILAGYSDRIRSRRLPRNRGGGHARNLGATLARGEFLMFLDADDVLMPGTLSALRAALSGTNGAAVAVCPWMQLHHKDGSWVVMDSGRPLVAAGDLVTAWLCTWYVPPCAVLWPRTLYEGTGGWDETLAAWQDTDLMIRSLIHGVGIRVAVDGEAHYRVHGAGESVSKVLSEAAVKSRMRVLEKVAAEAKALDRLELYREPIGQAYYRLARELAGPFPRLRTQCLRRTDQYTGRKPLSGSPLHRLLWKLLGIERKERVTTLLRKGKRAGHGGLPQ